MAHGGRTLRRLLQVGQPMGDASGLLQDPVDRPAGAWQALALQLLIARQVVQDRFGPRRPTQALGRLITHLENAVSHALADPLGRMLACPRATVQHLLVFWLCLLEALLPFLDPAKLHADCLGILRLREAGGAIASSGADWPALRSILLP